jgi:hypothetical protein
MTGWLMFDTDHPDQIGKTRGGRWEIHPITTIEVFSGGRGIELSPERARHATRESAADRPGWNKAGRSS